MFDAKRFCHKVFAQLDALADNDKVIWLDSDVLTERLVPMSVVDFLVDEDITYLGRDTYTETGFIGFNQNHDLKAFKDRYRSYYTEGKIYELPFWTDCHAFDASREGGHNLTPDGKGVDDVFSQSILGNYCSHLKGNRKFELYREGSDAIRSAI